MDKVLILILSLRISWNICKLENLLYILLNNRFRGCEQKGMIYQHGAVRTLGESKKIQMLTISSKYCSANSHRSDSYSSSTWVEQKLYEGVVVYVLLQNFFCLIIRLKIKIKLVQLQCKLMWLKHKDKNNLKIKLSVVFL